MTELELAVGVVREAPKDLLRELRQLEPRAELLNIGDTTWLLGRIRPAAPLERAGARLAAATNRATSERPVYNTDRRRWRFAQARIRGFLFIAEYKLRDPDARIVRDLEVMTFLDDHTSDDERADMSEADKLREQAEARADMADTERARSAWRWLFTRSHSVTRRERADPGPRSGFTRHQVMPT